MILMDIKPFEIKSFLTDIRSIYGEEWGGGGANFTEVFLHWKFKTRNIVIIGFC